MAAKKQVLVYGIAGGMSQIVLTRLSIDKQSDAYIFLYADIKDQDALVHIPGAAVAEKEAKYVKEAKYDLVLYIVELGSVKTIERDHPHLMSQLRSVTPVLFLIVDELSKVQESMQCPQDIDMNDIDDVVMFTDIVPTSSIYQLMSIMIDDK